MTDSHADSGDPGPTQAYQRALAQGRFLVQQCKDCGGHVFPPRALCSHCDSSDLKWVEPTGRATVHALPADQGPGNAGYKLALIELEEGPRMLAPVLGLAPEKVRVGLHVSAHVGMIDGLRAVVFYGLEQGSNEW